MCIRYVFYGYDSSTLIAEETVHASEQAAKGMWSSMIMSFIFAIPQLVIMLHCTNFQNVINSPYPQAVTTMWADAVGQKGAYVFLLFQILAGIATGCATILATARVVFAISRDSVLPFSHVWTYTSTTSHLPIHAVYLVTVLSILIAATIPFSSVAFTALGSVGTIAVLLSYAFPLAGRIYSRKSFHTGSFYLPTTKLPGNGTEWLSFVCICFILMISFALCLPYSDHWDPANFNYAPIMIGGITFVCIISWFGYARFWYVGPGNHGVPPESWSTVWRWWSSCRSD